MDEIHPPSHIKAPVYVNRLHMNAQMYSIADKYDIPRLKKEAAGKFDAAILEMMENQSKKTRTGASLFCEMLEAIPYIYSSTPDEDRRLRDIGAEIVHCKFRKHTWPPILPTLTDNVWQLRIMFMEYIFSMGDSIVMVRTTPWYWP